MRRWGRVPHVVNVRRPRKVSWILRATDDESPLRPAACRLDEQLLEPPLAIGGIRAEIRQIRTRQSTGINAAMRFGIDASVERRHAPGTEQRPQFVQRAAAGV